MGSSSLKYDIARALNWEIPEDEEYDGGMPPVMEERCWDLCDELPFAIHDMIVAIKI